VFTFTSLDLRLQRLEASAAINVVAAVVVKSGSKTAEMRLTYVDECKHVIRPCRLHAQVLDADARAFVAAL
jgi:hypothetical protein